MKYVQAAPPANFQGPVSSVGIPPLMLTPPPEYGAGHAPLSAPPRLLQQYVCDLCHVPLGDTSGACLRHMSAFRHPSISVYNTSVHPITGVSMHIN